MENAGSWMGLLLIAEYIIVSFLYSIHILFTIRLLTKSTVPFINLGRP